MQISLKVSAGHEHSLYTYYTKANAYLPEEALVAVPFGPPEDDHGVSDYVAQSWWVPADEEHPAHIELHEWVIDPQWDPSRKQTAWRREVERFDSTEALVEHIHTNLLAAGWKVYGS